MKEENKMDEITSGMNEYTPDIYTLEDDEGNELDFELVDILNFEGEKYFGLTPYGVEEGEEGDGDLVILKSKFEGDEELMVTIDDEEEYERVGNAFLKFLEEKYGTDDEE